MTDIVEQQPIGEHPRRRGLPLFPDKLKWEVIDYGTEEFLSFEEIPAGTVGKIKPFLFRVKPEGYDLWYNDKDLARRIDAKGIVHQGRVLDILKQGYYFVGFDVIDLPKHEAQFRCNIWSAEDPEKVSSTLIKYEKDESGEFQFGGGRLLPGDDESLEGLYTLPTSDYLTHFRFNIETYKGGDIE